MNPEIIPGRMTLLVTIFLVLINIHNTIQTNSPKVNLVFSSDLFFWIDRRLIIFLASKLVLSAKNIYNIHLNNYGLGNIWMSFKWSRRDIFLFSLSSYDKYSKNVSWHKKLSQTDWMLVQTLFWAMSLCCSKKVTIVELITLSFLWLINFPVLWCEKE